MEYRRLNELFLAIEVEQDFFSVKIHGLYIWKYLRRYIHQILLEKYEFSLSSTMSDITIQHKKKSSFAVLKSLIAIGGMREIEKNLPFFSEQRDLLCVLFPTRKRNGRYDEEVYVDKYYSQIRRHTYYALEWSPDIGQHALRPQTSNLRYICDDIILAWFGKKDFVDYSLVYRQFYHLILKKIEENFEIEFKLDDMRKINREIYLYYYKRSAYIRYYNFILKQICPKAILFYNLEQYYTRFLVEAAQNLKIKTVEIQHGIYSMDTAMVSCKCMFKGLKAGAPIKPDFALTYGEYFSKIFESDETKPLCIGRPDIYQKGINAKNTLREKKKKRLLFISSDDGVVEFLYRIWRTIDYNKYEVMLKLHPSEHLVWERRFPYLSEMDNVKIIKENYNNIYYWADRADYMIGKASTALYEALACPVVKIFLSITNDYTEYLLKKKYCLCLEKGETIMDVIEQVEKGEVVVNKFIQDDYIMYPKPMDRMDTVLDMILKKE